MKSLTRVLFLFLPAALQAQLPRNDKLIRDGNDLYRQEQYEQAAQKYQEALKADPASTTAKFNLANSFSKQGQQGEAIKRFTEISDNTGNPEMKGKAFYNKGAILSQQKKLEESIEVYKNALRQNPADKEARENLQKALLELKKKNPPKKKEQKENQKKQQNQQQQPRSKMNQKEAEQRLKLLEQKEKEVQQRLQKEKSKTGGGQAKDW
jgi:Ca-activated chloride channel family protein